MAISLENFTDDAFSAAGASSLTYSATTSGSNTLLLVGAYCDGSTSVTGVTYNTVAMTQIGSSVLVDGTNNAYIFLFYLIAPADGAHNVVVSATGNSGRIRSVSTQLSGCKQTGQPDASATNTSATTSVTGTVTTVASNTFVYCFGGCETNGDWTAGTGSATIGTPGSAPDAQFQHDSNPVETPGATSMTINNSSATEMGVIIISVAPVEDVVVTSKLLNLLGVGN